MNVLIGLPDLLCEVKYFVAVMLDLIVEILRFYLCPSILTRFKPGHELSELFPVSEGRL